MLINAIVLTGPSLIAILGVQISLWCFILERPKSIFQNSSTFEENIESSQMLEQSNSEILARSQWQPTAVYHRLPLFSMLITLNFICFMQIVSNILYLYEAYLFIRFTEYQSFDEWWFTIDAIGLSSLSLMTLAYAIFHEKFRQVATELLHKVT